jgi:DNA polymerase III sliding clamp (beta) subunit (PCNA family)
VSKTKDKTICIEEVSSETSPGGGAAAPTPTRMVVISGATTNSALPTYRPEDIPVPEEPDLTGSVQIPIWRLRGLIEATTFAADPHATRYALGGCAFEFHEGTLSIIATDGTRLAHAAAKAAGGLSPVSCRDGDLERPLAPVVGVKPLKALWALLGEASNPNARVEIGWTKDGFLLARTAELWLQAQQLEGRFPDWRDIIPAPSPHVARITDVVRFRNALKEARDSLPEGQRAVRFRLRRNVLSIEVDADGTSGRSELLTLRKDMTPETEEVSTEFVPSRLLDWSEVVSAFTIEFPDGEGRPAVFRSEGLTFYVMPLEKERTAQERPCAEGRSLEKGVTAADSGGVDSTQASPMTSSPWQAPELDQRPIPETEGGGVMPEADNDRRPRQTQAPREAPSERGVRPASGLPEERPHNDRNRGVRPVRSIRLGRIRAAIWANPTEGGTVYNTTFERLLKREGSDTWESNDSFVTHDLPLLAKVADRAHTWIMSHGGNDDRPASTRPS